MSLVADFMHFGNDPTDDRGWSPGGWMAVDYDDENDPIKFIHLDQDVVAQWIEDNA